MFYFVCIALPFVNIFLIFLLFQYFRVYFLKLYCYFYCVAFLFLPQHVSVFFSFVFVCFRKFFICFSRRISRPGFDFLFLLFKGNPIFTN